MIRNERGQFITERQAREDASPVRYGALLVHASSDAGNRWHLAERDDANQAFLTSEDATSYAVDASRTAHPGTAFAILSHDGDARWVTKDGASLGAAIRHLATESR